MLKVQERKYKHSRHKQDKQHSGIRIYIFGMKINMLLWNLKQNSLGLNTYKPSKKLPEFV